MFFKYSVKKSPFKGGDEKTGAWSTTNNNVNGSENSFYDSWIAIDHGKSNDVENSL